MVADDVLESQLLVDVEDRFLQIVRVVDAEQQAPGLLGKAQRAWLRKYLASNGDKPCVFFIHHTLGDGDGRRALEECQESKPDFIILDIMLPGLQPSVRRVSGLLQRGWGQI